MWEVLALAEHDLRLGGDLATAARAWIVKDDLEWPFSFLNIAFRLGLEPDYLRRGFAHYGSGIERTNKCRVKAGERLPYGVHRCGKGAKAKPYRVTTYFHNKAAHYLFATLEEAVAFRQDYQQQKKQRRAA